MIISGEQARIAARYAEPSADHSGPVRASVAPDLMDRIVSAIDAVPETRADRVIEAMERQQFARPQPHEIAEMIIARAICDSLR